MLSSTRTDFELNRLNLLYHILTHSLSRRSLKSRGSCSFNKNYSNFFFTLLQPKPERRGRDRVFILLIYQFLLNRHQNIWTWPLVTSGRHLGVSDVSDHSYSYNFYSYDQKWPVVAYGRHLGDTDHEWPLLQLKILSFPWPAYQNIFNHYS